MTKEAVMAKKALKKNFTTIQVSPHAANRYTQLDPQEVDLLS